MDDILVDIAVKIIQYKIKNSLSQKELAAKLGINQAMVSKLESVDYNPTVKMLYEIAQKLGFELEIEFREKNSLCTALPSFQPPLRLLLVNIHKLIEMKHKTSK